ncbi:hypothetical protein HK100_012597 [Physocladia obscura]|uniref:Uncharacterized protein n=1 Tax=Physocladia obscura TaxID=109957 RepID=A0AAD5T100_9FUNG|nr:hypothetical protein HK100_012597 [Physocladia obscura]
MANSQTPPQTHSETTRFINEFGETVEETVVHETKTVVVAKEIEEEIIDIDVPVETTAEETEGDIAGLAEQIAANADFAALELTEAQLTDEDIIAIGNALHFNTNLEKLDLSGNEISDTGLASLAKAIIANKGLRELVIGSQIRVTSADLQQALADAVSENNQLLTFVYAFESEVHAATVQAALDRNNAAFIAAHTRKVKKTVLVNEEQEVEKKIRNVIKPADSPSIIEESSSAIFVTVENKDAAVENNFAIEEQVIAVAAVAEETKTGLIEVINVESIANKEINIPRIEVVSQDRNIFVKDDGDSATSKNLQESDFDTYEEFVAAQQAASLIIVEKQQHQLQSRTNTPSDESFHVVQERDLFSEEDRGTESSHGRSFFETAAVAVEQSLETVIKSTTSLLTSTSQFDAHLDDDTLDVIASQAKDIKYSVRREDYETTQEYLNASQNYTSEFVSSKIPVTKEVETHVPSSSELDIFALVKANLESAFKKTAAILSVRTEFDAHLDHNPSTLSQEHAIGRYDPNVRTADFESFHEYIDSQQTFTVGKKPLPIAEAEKIIETHPIVGNAKVSGGKGWYGSTTTATEKLNISDIDKSVATDSKSFVATAGAITGLSLLGLVAVRVLRS